MEIEFKNKIYIFTRDPGLTEKQFIEKCWFVARQEPKNTSEFKEAEKNAGLMINIVFLKCRYNSVLENRIYSLLKNDNYFCRYA